MMFNGPTRPLRHFVPGGYLAQVRGEVWEGFVARVVELLVLAAGKIAANEPGYDDQAHPTWWTKGRRSAHGQKVAIALEDSVTDALCRAVWKLRHDLPADHFMRVNQIFVAEQQPRERQKRRGSSALTTDLRIASSELRYLDLRIEAKPLFDSGDVTRYCGYDGLMRFADTEPYTDKAVGMMLGYTFRHDDLHWYGRIVDVASRKHNIQSFETIDAEGRPLKMCRLRWSGNDVCVLHLLLPFPSSPCARSLDAAAA